MGQQPTDGFVRNPLRELPRNMACPCGSGKKFKKCCLDVTRLYIPREHLDEYSKTAQLAREGRVAW